MKIAKFFSTITGVLLLGLVAFQARAGVTLTTLVSFNGTNTPYGAGPRAGLVQGADGSFYGTTYHGGTNNAGTIFQLTTNGTLTTLVTLAFDTGGLPTAGLIQGQDGNFYGATVIGGSNSYGTIFKLATNGAFATLVSFGNTNGASPYAGLVQANDGSLYGTTYGTVGPPYGYGTIFKLTTSGTFGPLYSFTGTNDGADPYAGLVQGTDGSLYGTTFYGGSNGYGAVFKLTTNGTFSPLYSFTGTFDGANPYAGLVQGTDGSFYGTTYNEGSNGYGTVFKFATNGVLTTLVSFGNTNGASPYAGLVQGADGSFYGSTYQGGTYGYGTVFKLGTNGTLTTLLSFDGTNGAYPEGVLIQGADGSFYGTTAGGDTNGHGTVFRLSITAPPPPSFLAVEGAGTTLTLTWSATVGQTYQMLYKTNLNQTTWNNLNNALTATNPTMTTFDAIGPDPQRFYRILLLLP